MIRFSKPGVSLSSHREGCYGNKFTKVNESKPQVFPSRRSTQRPSGAFGASGLLPQPAKGPIGPQGPQGGPGTIVGPRGPKMRGKWVPKAPWAPPDMPEGPQAPPATSGITWPQIRPDPGQNRPSGGLPGPAGGLIWLCQATEGA